jgi:nucleoside-diphosphate-sugar epimerase
VDVGGARRLLDESIRAGVQRFIFPSTLGAYALGELRDGAVVTEEMIDDPEQVGPYARAKLLVERMVMDAHRAGSLEGVVVRPGVVFGPGTSPYLPHMPHLGTRVGNRYVVFGDGRVRPPLTYVGNTVEAMWLCATSSRAPGATFTLVDDELPTQREFVRQLAALTGTPLSVRAIPKLVAFMVGLGVEGLAGAARKRPPTTRRLLLGKTVKLTFDCTRAKDVLGWTPAVRWREGLRAAVEHETAVPGAEIRA